MRYEAGGAFVVGLMVSACAVVGPLANPRMTDAPHAACVAIGQPAPAADQCFTLAEQLPDGTRRAWQGGALGPGQVLLAVHGGGEACAGTFTHLTVTADSPGAGRAELATWDAHVRPGHAREIHWREGFAGRTFALADIGSALMNPAGARITVREGTLEPSQLCFKSY
ncbi:hypothetical protein [Sphingosinicella sp. YJ22]|uniref:hypothetical protein n=1 Tax=Sphingosinicella sp. YJ22 TaxID=1104780 RepID=UPI00140AE5A3|nr:hypothetical protein [Sphingosinicella sp. YJ22]